MWGDFLLSREVGVDFVEEIVTVDLESLLFRLEDSPGGFFRRAAAPDRDWIRLWVVLVSWKLVEKNITERG